MYWVHCFFSFLPWLVTVICQIKEELLGQFGIIDSKKDCRDGETGKRCCSFGCTRQFWYFSCKFHVLFCSFFFVGSRIILFFQRLYWANTTKTYAQETWGVWRQGKWLHVERINDSNGWNSGYSGFFYSVVRVHRGSTFFIYLACSWNFFCLSPPPPNSTPLLSNVNRKKDNFV